MVYLGPARSLTGCTRCDGGVVFLPRSLTVDESTSKISQVVRRVHLLVVIGPRASDFSLAASWRLPSLP